jgi:hypothetical protein
MSAALAGKDTVDQALKASQDGGRPRDAQGRLLQVSRPGSAAPARPSAHALPRSTAAPRRAIGAPP